MKLCVEINDKDLEKFLNKKRKAGANITNFIIKTLKEVANA